MNDNLLKVINRLVLGLIFTFAIITGLLVDRINLKQEHKRLHAIELSYIKRVNETRISTNLLCQVNDNLEKILSMEIPQWKGSWEKDMAEACK